jgi:ABC-type sulfate/molybdate transport systems ATPase subunit
MIEIRDLVKCFGQVRAVDRVTLQVNGGEAVVVQGPSGGGKTTLLRLLAGLELPDAGEILLDDLVVSSASKAVAPHARGIGMVFQRSALWPHMTVAQNIAFAMNAASAHETGHRLRELLAQVKLEDLAGRFPSQLSGGEARRVALARAIAARPRRLLLDEPLINLDPDLKRHLLQLIRAYAEEVGATLVYVTHSQHEAEQVGGRVIRMERGRIVA